MLACAYYTAQRLQRQNTFALSDVLSGIAGVAMVLMVVTGSFFKLLEMASFSPPVQGYLEIAGEYRPLYRMSIIAVPALYLGIFSIGFTVSSVMLRLLDKPPAESNGDSNTG